MSDERPLPPEVARVKHEVARIKQYIAKLQRDFSREGFRNRIAGAVQIHADAARAAAMSLRNRSRPEKRRTIVFHDDDNSEPRDDLSDPEDEPAAAVDAQARLSSPVISNLAGVRTPSASGFDCSNDINMKEPSFYEKRASSWNWSTQETMLAVEAVLYVMDNAGECSAPELNRLANHHYELKVQSAVRDGTWKVGGAAEAELSIELRSAGVEGKAPKKQVVERFKHVRREIFAGCLPTWKRNYPIPSGLNLDDVLLRVKQAYYLHWAQGRKKAPPEMPANWTDAIFECFRKYGPPAGKKALEVFGAPVPDRKDPKDGKLGSTTTSRQDVRNKMKLDNVSKQEYGDTNNPAFMQAWIHMESLNNENTMREQNLKERCVLQAERSSAVERWKNALEMIEKMPDTMKPPPEYVNELWREYMKALKASTKTVRTPPMSPANVKRVRMDDQASSPSESSHVLCGRESMIIPV